MESVLKSLNEDKLAIDMVQSPLYEMLLKNSQSSEFTAIQEISLDLLVRLTTL